MRHLWGRKWALALGVGVAILAVLPAASSAATNGPTTVVLTKYGFSVTLPAGWQRVTLSKAGFSKLDKYLSKRDPAMAQTFASNESTALHMQLYAIGPPQGSSFPNINVLVQSPADLPSGNSFLVQAQPVMKSVLTQQGFSNVQISVAHLPFGSALEGQYSLLGVTGSQVTQFYISHKGRLYIVTITPASAIPELTGTWHWR